MRYLLHCGTILAAVLAAAPEAAAQRAQHLRVGMTAADVPTTTGMPTNGGEGLRFAGYPVFEALVDWELLGPIDRRAPLRAGLATEWSADPNDRRVWTFKLRENIRFHDGTKLDANAVAWNLGRFYDEKSPQFEAQAAGIARSAVPQIDSWEVVDPSTIRIRTKAPFSYFPYLIARILIAGPERFERVGRNWNEYGKAPTGTGTFRITRVNPRTSIELEKNASYWDPARIPKLDRMTVFPMPEANTRLAALRSGQVDWIEVPPPDSVPSLKAAGFQISTNNYPHTYPYVFNMLDNSPFRDKRVRHAANWAIDREGIVQLLNGTAQPATSFVNPGDRNFGEIPFRFGYDPAKAKALLAEAGYGPGRPVPIKVMISTSGSGQMMPIPMNELMQQNLEAVGFKVEFDVVEWGQMLLGFRSPPDSAINRGRHAMNISLGFADPSAWYRFFHSDAATPVSNNWGHWKEPRVDALLDRMADTYDPEEVDRLLGEINAILVEESPWMWIVHDLNPRALSSRVQGFKPAQSWFQDFTQITIR